MSISVEEKKLIEKLRSGVMDGPLYEDHVLSNGIVIRYEIMEGKIVWYMQRSSSNIIVIKEWESDERYWHIFRSIGG